MNICIFQTICVRYFSKMIFLSFEHCFAFGILYLGLEVKIQNDRFFISFSTAVSMRVREELGRKKNPLFNSVLSRLQMALKQSVATRQLIISAQITTNSFSIQSERSTVVYNSQIHSLSIKNHL